jgi:hypothetical protein
VTAIDRAPENAMCGCDCGCERLLNDGNVMGEQMDVKPADIEPNDAEESVVWHVDPDTVDMEAVANAPVYKLICADCFVGNHKSPES